MGQLEIQAPPGFQTPPDAAYKGIYFSINPCLCFFFASWSLLFFSFQQ
jgi:hypothetical protein